MTNRAKMTRRMEAATAERLRSTKEQRERVAREMEERLAIFEAMTPEELLSDKTPPLGTTRGDVLARIGRTEEREEWTD